MSYATDGRLVSVSCGVSPLAKLVYNGFDLIQVQHLSHTINLQYDSYHNLTGITRDNDWLARLTYDPSTDRVIEYADKLGRRVQLSHYPEPSGSASIGIKWSEREGLKFAIDKTGRLSEMNFSGRRTVNFSYDYSGRLLRLLELKSDPGMERAKALPSLVDDLKGAIQQIVTVSSLNAD
jgi:hypothetical protein